MEMTPDAATDAGSADAGLPSAPTALVRFETGDPRDRDVRPSGPALILMGGGVEVDEAFEAWRTWVAGGDVVVLRTSGSDGYQDYLFTDIGGVDSVETMLVTSRALANDPYVAWRVETAEGIWLAGGDQSTYVHSWKGTAVEDALHAAYARGAAVGGTSAGCAVLGEIAFAAHQGTIGSSDALADPYHLRVTLEAQFLRFAPLAGVITDTHFAQRDRMGRLITFLARVRQDGLHADPIAVGVDERTALVIGPDGVGRVMGRGAVYVMTADSGPRVCAAGRPLEFEGITAVALRAGDTARWPGGATALQGSSLSASTGTLTPSDPY